MTYLLTIATLSSVFILGQGSVIAQDKQMTQPKTAGQASQYVLPPGITEEMLAPPPVPQFMLEQPAKPLTTQQMIEQARDAERKASVGLKTVDENQARKNHQSVQ